MSEWAQHEQLEVQKHLKAGEEVEALDPSRQAAAAQSAELAEEPVEETGQHAGPQTAPTDRLRERAQAGQPDLMGLQERAPELANAGAGGAAGVTQGSTTASEGQKAGIEVAPPPLEVQAAHLDSVASRAGRGGSAAELLGVQERTERADLQVGRGLGREVDALLAQVRAAFETSPLGRKRRRLHDLADPELDALVAAARAALPAGPEVEPVPEIGSWVEAAGGLEFEDRTTAPTRGVLDARPPR